MGTILVSFGLTTTVGLAIRQLIKDKKEGKSSCGCNCNNCPMGGKCHSK